MRELREAAKLTLERASSDAEMDLAHWQKIEAGRVNVTLGTMIRVSLAIGVPLASFFREEPESVRKREGKRPVGRPALRGPTRTIKRR